MTRNDSRKFKSYNTARKDIINLIDNSSNLLELGCSNCATFYELKKDKKINYYTGIDIVKNNNFPEDNRTKYMQRDLNRFDISELSGNYDVLIAADVIEHLYNRDVIFEIIRSRLSKNNQIIFSIPNVQHVSVLVQLLKGNWPERSRGTFDKTHLKFYTRKSFLKLLEENNIEIVAIHRKFRITDSPTSKVNKFSFISRYLPFKDFFTYQYIFECRYNGN